MLALAVVDGIAVALGDIMGNFAPEGFLKTISGLFCCFLYCWGENGHRT